MNKIFNYFSKYFGTKDLSQYPVFHNIKKNFASDFDYNLNVAQSSRIYDPDSEPSPLAFRKL